MEEVQAAVTNDLGVDENGEPPDRANVATNPEAAEHADNTQIQNHGDKSPVTSSGWLDWLRHSNTEIRGLSQDASPPVTDSGVASIGVKLSEETTKTVSVNEPLSSDRLPDSAVENRHEEQVGVSASTASWFSFWPISNSSKATSENASIDRSRNPADASIVESAAVPVGNGSNAPTAGSTWAFWSKDSAKPSSNETGTEDSGELAVTGEPSQNDPKPAHATIPDGGLKVNSGKQTKRGRQLLATAEEPLSNIAQTDGSKKMLYVCALSPVNIC
jgi:hypothetical protein